MPDSRNDPITVTEIQRVTQHCQNLLSCTGRLRLNAEARDAHTYAKELFPVIRKLIISTLMYHRTLICVSGLQGAGKTTLMKNFYGLDDQYLSPTLSRGERLPVLITEKKGITRPEAYAIRIEEDSKGDYVQREIPRSEEEFAFDVTGADEQVIYLELRVPFQHTNCESISFLLLPGFEKSRDYWNNLIEFSVNSSNAAVFVFNEAGLANAANENCLDWIEARFGKNLVYAITGSDGSRDDNAAVKQTCLQCLNIPASESDRVVCTGQYVDKAKNKAWIKAFKTALGKYAYDTQQFDKNSGYLYDVLEEITCTLYSIQGILDQTSEAAQLASFGGNALLKTFDEGVKKQRERFSKELEDQFRVARNKSEDSLGRQFEKISKISLLKRVFLGNGLKQYQETKEIIERSLQAEGSSLPNEYMQKALLGSLNALDHPQDKTYLGRLVAGDIEENGENRILLLPGENIQAVANDVRALLCGPQKDQTTIALQCREPKRLMRSVAELGTYYFSMESYDQIALETGMKPYQPAEIDSVAENMLNGAEASKKFMVGMAGMMGIDLLGDGTINLVSQIAASLGVAAPVAGAVAIAAVGAGAITAIVRDVTRMQREDFISAKVAVGEAYDQIKQEVLEKYDRYMERIRDQIEENIGAAHAINKQIIDIYNAQMEVNAALELLDTLSQRVLKVRLPLWGWN